MPATSSNTPRTPRSRAMTRRTRRLRGGSLAACADRSVSEDWPTVWEIFLLAVGSMFWPLLLAVDVVAFRTDRPVALRGGFLAGVLIAMVAGGGALVFSWENPWLATSAKRTTDASVDITLGVVALAAAAVIYRRRPRPSAE